MVKSCSVIGCRTGGKAERNKRKLKGIRQLSLFLVPKCPVRRKQWIEFFNQPLTETDRICELHFSENDVKKSDSFIIQGQVTTIHNIRYTLRPDAVPIFHESIMIECDQTPDLQISQEQLLETEQEQEGIQYLHDNLLETEQSRTDVEISEHQNENILTADCNELQMAEDLPDQDQDETLEDIIGHFEAVMPEGWLYYKKQPDVIFVYFDVNNLVAKIQVRCTSDRRVMISYQQHDEVNTGITITSADDIHKVMKEAASSTLCKGTDIENRHASECTGVIDNREFKRFRRFDRCKKCSDLRRKLLQRIAQRRQSDIKKSYKKKQYVIARKNGDVLSDFIFL